MSCRKQIRNFSALFLFAGFLSAFGVSVAHGADTNPPPRLTVELRDGSRIIGTSVEKSLKFHSSLLGSLKLDVKDICSMDCISNNSIRLTMTDGDNFLVSPVDPELGVKTSFGRIELAIASIRRVTVQVNSGSGALPEGLVGFWSGK